MKLDAMSRRRFLAVAAAGGAGVAVGVGPIGGARAAVVPAGPARSQRSANGWPVLEHATPQAIEGSGRTVRLAGGDAAVILTHVARRFHYEIDALRAGDVQGHTTTLRHPQPYETNYTSGSALAIRPVAYPVGVKGGLYPAELVVVQDILAELDGVVAWGGDFSRPKESHFEIAYGPGDPRVRAVARRIGGWTQAPGGEGAGAVDAFDPRRRAKARAFARSRR